MKNIKGITLKKDSKSENPIAALSAEYNNKIMVAIKLPNNGLKNNIF